MKNFKQSVPLLVQAKIHAIAYHAQLALSDIVIGNFEREGETQLHEIEGNYKSGWMPKQDGGFSVDTFIRCDIDSSYHLTEKQTEFVNDQSEQCYKAFLSDNGIDENVELTEDQKQEYYEHEIEWFSDGALLQFQIFAEGYDSCGFSSVKEPSITMRVSVNYKDTPYFREKYAEDMKVLCMDEKEFMETSIEDIIKQLKV